jgi:hypothetical protein
MRKPLAVLALSVLTALAQEPLPKELARQLDLARMLPPEIGGSILVDLIREAEIDKEQKAGIAFEAYLVATGFGVTSPPVYAARAQEDVASWLASADYDRPSPAAAALLAWAIYEENHDPERRPSLEFPARPVPQREGCPVAYVQDPFDYYDAAFKASPEIFAQAREQSRYAVDFGRLAEVMSKAGDAARNTAALLRLLNVQSSDRQFAYAMQFTRLHRSMLRIASEAGAETGKMLYQRYANYLTRHFAQPRCEGNQWMDYRGVIAEFNDSAKQSEAQWRQGAVVRLPLEAGLAKSVDPDSYTEKDADWQDLLYLRFRIASAQPNDTSFRSILRDVERFEAPSRLPAPLRLLQKNFAFRLLSVQFKNTPYLDEVMASWLYEIARSRLQKQAPQVWWTAVDNVLDWIGGDRRRQAMAEFAGDPALAAIIRLLDESPNPLKP